MSDGTSGYNRGIYSDENFALPVVQQPSGQAGFVSTIDGVTTQFSMPNKYGVTGLLAHNYSIRKTFLQIEYRGCYPIVYGNGEIKEYHIADIQKYQALQPNSQTVNLLNLIPGKNISATQLFKRVYMGNHSSNLADLYSRRAGGFMGKIVYHRKSNIK